VSFEVGAMIRSGTLQSLLTRPLSLGAFLLLRNSGRTFLAILSSVLVFIGIYFFFGGTNLHLYLLGLILALLFYLFLGQAIGYLSTWFYTIWGFQTLLVYAPSLLFGGALIPLDLLPKPLVEIAQALPWKYLHYDLAMTVLGKPLDILPLLGWLLVAFVAERLLFKLMTRKWEQWGG
ncbi:MAG: ABC transporter permease, partial [Candidatus Diapherotrites archaeon]|nr:ABC transporter permease [Candidatus Diapherotrites archaeon]